MELSMSMSKRPNSSHASKSVFKEVTPIVTSLGEVGDTSGDSPPTEHVRCAARRFRTDSRSESNRFSTRRSQLHSPYSRTEPATKMLLQRGQTQPGMTRGGRRAKGTGGDPAPGVHEIQQPHGARELRNDTIAIVTLAGAALRCTKKPHQGVRSNGSSLTKARPANQHDGELQDVEVEEQPVGNALIGAIHRDPPLESPAGVQL
eukprot:5962756-Prymnesium_polylepis.2